MKYYTCCHFSSNDRSQGNRYPVSWTSCNSLKIFPAGKMSIFGFFLDLPLLFLSWNRILSFQSGWQFVLGFGKGTMQTRGISTFTSSALLLFSKDFQKKKDGERDGLRKENPHRQWKRGRERETNGRAEEMCLKLLSHSLKKLKFLVLVVSLKAQTLSAFLATLKFNTDWRNDRFFLPTNFPSLSLFHNQQLRVQSHWLLVSDSHSLSKHCAIASSAVQLSLQLSASLAPHSPCMREREMERAEREETEKRRREKNRENREKRRTKE